MEQKSIIEQINEVQQLKTEAFMKKYGAENNIEMGDRMWSLPRGTERVEPANTKIEIAIAKEPEMKPYFDESKIRAQIERIKILENIEAYCKEAGISPDQLISEHKYWKAEAIKRLEEATRK